MMEAETNNNFKCFDLQFGTQSLLPDGKRLIFREEGMFRVCSDLCCWFHNCLLVQPLYGLIFFFSPNNLNGCFVHAGKPAFHAAQSYCNSISNDAL